jgi:hypothetical protein
VRKVILLQGVSRVNRPAEILFQTRKKAVVCTGFAVRAV